MSLSAILTEAYNFFRNHLVQLAMLTVPLLLIQVGIQLWLGAEMSKADLENPQFGAPHMLAMMLLLLTFSVLIAALTLFLELRSQGHHPSAGMVLKASLPFVPPLLLAGVFSGLAILAPVMLFAAFGPMWLIGLVISFYLFARLAYVNFMVVVERLTPLEAIKGSFSFSGPIVLKTIALLMLYLPLAVISSQLASIAAMGGLPLQMLVDTFMSFIGLFVNLALFRLYMVSKKPTVE
ncbi:MULTISPECIES: hypothetical protein [Shewanella]|uniref:Uncharacterized protein n=4 Tax=Shewanella putrefaciens TaxID=24 RepID=E6XIK2_SHEP2|nr:MULTISPECIES: hypothetical protein [Shewanella]CAD6365700.1 hypothetical protein SHEWT2_03585 [Shewanella hafniensis]ABM26692.1 conserved hypothetical protein [Shewanella sp. W3-18-1]AVV84748.1 hypothetical protein SPWS13_3008 [Shewanella putrefaciens]MCK7630961.1 hypothetical protein [Shewanella sp. JNE9-1]MCK7633953.1 hypothetical protein [Shewanella sp. JNE17]